MSAPRVSILIPCYNAEAFIGATLDTVLRQTWPKLEIIVVDDASEDKSAQTVERFRNVRLIRQEKNRGAAAARNRAYYESTGEYIQFIDADDLIDPHKIERQIGRLAGSPNRIASCEWGRFYASPNETQFNSDAVWQDLAPVDWLSSSRADGHGMMFPALWLVPRAVANAAGPWDESLTLGDDAEYFTRVLLASTGVLFCPGARCYYRSGMQNSLSGRKTPTAWHSQFRVLELCERYVREREDSDRVRCGFALSWQHLAHACYPYHPVLAAEALKRAGSLHRVTIRPSGGPAFHVISRLVGWRAARWLQVASGRP